jgi:hypothetical protein
VRQRKTEKHSKSWEVAVASEISQLLLLLKARFYIVECLMIDRLKGGASLKMQSTFLSACQYKSPSSNGALVPTLTEAFLIAPNNAYHLVFVCLRQSTLWDVDWRI